MKKILTNAIAVIADYKPIKTRKNGMLETENELSEVLTTFLVLEKQARMFSSSSNSLEQLNLELKFRIKQLEKEIELNNF